MKFLIYSVCLLCLLAGNACADKASDQSDELIQPDTTVKGCGDFSLYKKVDTDMLLRISIDHTQISFSTDYQSFDNIASRTFAQVSIEQNCDMEALWHNACNDAILPTSCNSTTWKLQSGRLSFKVNKVLSHYACNTVYYASLILENATFVKANSNETKFFEKLTITNAKVGTCAG